MEFRPPIPRNLATWGWPWHGLILEPQSGDSYIQLPNGKTHTPPSTSISSMQGGHWSYLWDIGLPDREATPDEIEQGMAWWGRAILRNRGVGVGQVYGRIDMAGLAGSGSWPVLLDDGVAWVRLDASQAAGSAQFTLRFTFRRTIIGTAPIDPVEVTLPPADYGQGAGQPDVFTTRVESPALKRQSSGRPESTTSLRMAVALWRRSRRSITCLSQTMVATISPACCESIFPGRSPHPRSMSPSCTTDARRWANWYMSTPGECAWPRSTLRHERRSARCSRSPCVA